MTAPPTLWGRTPQLLPEPDPRWLAVKDAHCPIFTFPGGEPQSIHVDNFINASIDYAAELRDNWASPTETWDRGRGDCEDYAVLKRALLLRHGFSDDRIWLLLVDDVLARCDHAVLLVHDDRWRILDCRKSLAGGALPVEQVQDFTALEAMQGNERWKYGEGN